jgi:predicted enzyme related to lactoylglutathione lyase
MSLRIQCVCVDTADPSRIARFWAAALDWRITHEEPGETVVGPPAGSPAGGAASALLFLQVPEDKAVKNRLHLDLLPADRDAEVRRLRELGATLADVGQGPDVTWVVMADPDGNEFCVLSPPQEQAASGQALPA